MKKLKMFGFPLSFDNDKNILNPEEENVTYLDYSRKLSEKMFGLFEDKSYNIKDEPFYDFYKSIGRNEERKYFEEDNLRYDCTVILPGLAGKEFKKTSGHFHCNLPQKNISYPELYQVIKGKALFVMQKVKDEQASTMTVEDTILAEVSAGEAVVIPPNYGHCTVNISDETMIFVNLVSCNSENFYDSVKDSAGMCCYINKDEIEGYKIIRNKNYNFNGDIRVVRPGDSEVLGIKKDFPVYTEFLSNPDKYKYLNEPDVFDNEYLSVFK